MDVNAEIEEFNYKYRSFLDAGMEEAANLYMEKEFGHLSKEAQDKILTQMLVLAIEDEVEGPELVADMQETGLQALKELGQIEKSGGEGESPQG